MISSDWTLPYDFVLYRSLSNAFKNAWIDILAGLLNASKAWYLVILESFLDNLFKLSILASTSVSLAISSLSISSTASSDWSSRDNTSAEPCLFAGKLVKHLHTVMSLSQSSYVLHFDRDGGVLELFDA